MKGPAYHGRTHAFILNDDGQVVGVGTDPIPFPELAAGPDPASGPGLEDLVLSKSPVGLWKLNDASGTTAVDSSGNSNNMTVPGGGYIAPTWAQASGPPGTQSAQFIREPSNSDAGTRLTVATTALTNNFSGGVWVKLAALTLAVELIGQQQPYHGTTGWSLMFDVDGSQTKFAVYIGNVRVIFANNNATTSAWYLVGLTRSAGTTTMYVNGLAQSTTSATAPTGTSTNTWLGNCGVSTAGAHGSNDQLMSWAFITSSTLDGADWEQAYATGVVPGAIPAGWVWTANGAGGASWEPLP